MKEKLIINTNQLRQESEFRTKSCVVEKAIAVSNAEFENLKRHPLRDNRLIAENVDLIDYNASPIFTDTARCITAHQNSGMSHHKGEHSAVFVDSNRESTYCKKVDKRFVEELNRKKPKDLQTIKRLWYGDNAEYHSHYDSSRYRYILFTDNNIEIRAFNSSLNAGVLRAYISLILAVSNKALTQKSASPRVTQSENPRYTFRCWLIRIGLNGQEFKNCRKHLLSHLEGNIAWLHPEDAIKQRERLKAERIAAREQRVEPVREVRQQADNVPDAVLGPQENERETVFENEDSEQEETFEMSM